jgi:hypothetical protein
VTPTPSVPAAWVNSVSTVRQPDPQTPLLTVFAGGFRWATGAGPYRLLAVEQVFYVVAVWATCWGARRLANRNWSLVAAVMVAALPGVVDSSREFAFALPAAAMIASVWLFVLGAFLVLSSTRNIGSSFELPVLPAVIILATYAASRAATRVRPHLGRRVPDYGGPVVRQPL